MTSLVAFLVRALSGVQVRWLGADPLDCQRVYFANHTSNLDAAVLWYLVRAAGLPPEDARELLAPLVRRTVDNWAALGAEAALTGPVARGDEATVAGQRAAIEERAPDLLETFDALVAASRVLVTT